MGILNVTPDSFSDGGEFLSVSDALLQARQMLTAGADILDIGGESTRPGSDPVTAEQQIARVVPVIAAIREQLGEDVLISIDTTSAAVASAALDAGAHIINDISAGTHDKGMFALAATQQASIILMHMQGIPKTMQENPCYADVVEDVLGYLRQRVTIALQAGIPPEHIAIDPGIGFGKRREDNLQLLAHLDRFAASGYAVLLGTSRKRFMGSICAIQDPKDLVTATAVTTALGVMAGVKLFRVHDVQANKQALDVAWAIKQSASSD